jgi:hypothetical protein
LGRVSIASFPSGGSGDEYAAWAEYSVTRCVKASGAVAAAIDRDLGGMEKLTNDCVLKKIMRLFAIRLLAGDMRFRLAPAQAPTRCADTFMPTARRCRIASIGFSIAKYSSMDTIRTATMTVKAIMSSFIFRFV